MEHAKEEAMGMNTSFDTFLRLCDVTEESIKNYPNTGEATILERMFDMIISLKLEVEELKTTTAGERR